MIFLHLRHKITVLTVKIKGVLVLLLNFYCMSCVGKQLNTSLLRASLTTAVQNPVCSLNLSGSNLEGGGGLYIVHVYAVPKIFMIKRI